MAHNQRCGQYSSLMKKLLILIVLTRLGTYNVMACSCGKLGSLTKSGLTEERIAFVGRVIEVTYIDDYNMKTSFEIEEDLMNEKIDGIVEI